LSPIPLFPVQIVAIGSALLSAVLWGGPALAQDLDAVPGQVIFKLGVGEDRRMPEFELGASLEELARVETGTIYLVRSPNTSTRILLARLRELPRTRIPYAEPNFTITLQGRPNDKRFEKVWGLRNTGQKVGTVVGLAGADVRADPAWRGVTGGPCVVVGILDTGIDYKHPDLVGNLWVNPGGIGNPACKAGTYGFNTIDDKCDPADVNGHGTHVAGTIGAIGNNGVGVAGVNWTTKIMTMKIIEGPKGLGARAVKAINLAVEAKIAGVNVRVLNNSWTTDTDADSLRDVVEKANAHDILVVAAAGNEKADNDTKPSYPASLDVPNVIAVTATDNRDGLWKDSNVGEKSVDLGAPGVDVYSTAKHGGFEYRDGTSMATAHVSGAAALILSSRSYNTAAVKKAILDGVEKLPSLAKKTVKEGRLDVCKALAACTDFSLVVAPRSVSIPPGEKKATYTVSVTRTGGFKQPVKLSASGLPRGTKTHFKPKSLTVGTATSILTVTVSSRTPDAEHPFTITGKGGQPSAKRAASVTLYKSP
jgi:serine protease